MAYPILPVILPTLSGGNSGAKAMYLPLLLALTLVLALTCSYLQSASIALAALWGSQETMAVMSGQGGIAVLVSSVQVVLAVLDSSRTKAPEDGASSTLAAFGLWALGAGFVVVCLMALRSLTENPAIHDVLAPLTVRQGANDPAKSGRITRIVAMKNIRLEMAVAFAFVVTLVSPSLSEYADAIVDLSSDHDDDHFSSGPGAKAPPACYFHCYSFPTLQRYVPRSLSARRHET